MLPPAKWFFDANAVGLGKVVGRVRSDVTWVGDSGERDGPARKWLPASPVQDQAAPDTEWIPIVSAAGLAIITRDVHIASRLLEHEQVRISGGRLFALTSAGSLSLWDQLRVVTAAWDRLERQAAKPGPYIFGVTATTIVPIYEW